MQNNNAYLDAKSTLEDIWFLIRIGEHQAAEILCDWLMEREPDRAEFYIPYAVVLHKQSKFSEALKVLTKAAGPTSYGREAYAALAIILAEVGQYDEAASCIQQLKEELGRKSYPFEYSRHKIAEAHLEVARNLGRMGQYADALQELRKAQGLAPENLEYRTLYIEYAFRLGQFQDAMAQITQVLDRDPHNAHALCFRGMICLHNQDRTGAVEFLKKSLTFPEAPKSAEVYLTLAK